MKSGSVRALTNNSIFGFLWKCSQVLRSNTWEGVILLRCLLVCLARSRRLYSCFCTTTGRRLTGKIIG